MKENSGRESGPLRAPRSIQVLETGAVLADSVEPALTLWLRLKGLLGRKHLAPGRGMYLEPCRQVHTLFMRFAIDVVFVDLEGRVVGLEHELRPWRMSAYYPAAEGALELPAGTAARAGLEEGHHLLGLPSRRIRTPGV